MLSALGAADERDAPVCRTMYMRFGRAESIRLTEPSRQRTSMDKTESGAANEMVGGPPDR